MDSLGRNIAEVGIAHLGQCVVLVHRVDGLGEFGAAGFIDAARIVPNPFVSVPFSDGAGLANLG